MLNYRFFSLKHRRTNESKFQRTFKPRARATFARGGWPGVTNRMKEDGRLNNSWHDSSLLYRSVVYRWPRWYRVKEHEEEQEEEVTRLPQSDVTIALTHFWRGVIARLFLPVRKHCSKITSLTIETIRPALIFPTPQIKRQRAPRKFTFPQSLPSNLSTNVPTVFPPFKGTIQFKTCDTDCCLRSY